MSNVTVTVGMIRAAADRTGASELDVRRIVLGLTPFNADRLRVVDALIAAGADGDFLQRVAQASRPLSDYVPRTSTDNSR